MWIVGNHKRACLLKYFAARVRVHLGLLCTLCSAYWMITRLCS